MARKTWVPTHSVIVIRDGKQVDALDEYRRTGKAFTFTDDEVKEIQALNPLSLEAPVNQGDDDAGEPVVTEGAGKVMSPGTDDAGGNVAKTDDAKETAAKKDGGKDADL